VLAPVPLRTAPEELELSVAERRRGAAEALAEACRDSPLTVAVTRGGPARRLRSNRHGMRAMLSSARRGAWALAADEPGGRAVAGALLAVPPLRFPLPPPPLRAQLRCVAGQGVGTVRRWGRVYRELLAIHPEEPHWYLAVLGIAPAHQGRGLGSALLAGLLAQSDADGRPVYLETDRAANLPFYERAGFRVARETRTLDVRVWCLWREPF